MPSRLCVIDVLTAGGVWLRILGTGPFPHYVSPIINGNTCEIIFLPNCLDEKIDTDAYRMVGLPKYWTRETALSEGSGPY